MTPNEYIIATPELKDSVLYYPGSGLDSGPVKLFGANTTLKKVVYCDYGVNQADADHFVCNIEGFIAEPISELRPVDFNVNDWDAFWPRNPGATRFHNYQTAFGIKTTLSHKSGSKFDFIYLATESVQTHTRLLNAGIVPNIVVLHDHGFGENWTSFGAGGELEELAERCVMPEFLFVAQGTQPWGDYEQVSDYALYDGQMHAYPRAVFRRSTET